MADTIEQGFFKVHPDGTVTFEFDGHVVADGLDLIAGDAQRSELLQWLDALGGNQLASISYDRIQHPGPIFGPFGLVLNVGPANTRLLLGIDGSSDYVQDTAESVAVIRGDFTTNPANKTGGAGFTLARNGVGDVTVNFSTPFAATPTFLFTANGNTSLAVTDAIFVGAGSARARIKTTADVAQEGTGHFVAAGPTV